MIAQENQPDFSDEALEDFAQINAYETVIKVLGVGGAGNNTVNFLMDKDTVGVQKIAVNTDAQNLISTQADKRILIGKRITAGLGAGGDPMIGESSAEESADVLKTVIDDADMVFLTCGLGGGTGTGALPVIGGIAKEKGILTVGIVTMPFSDEGIIRWENAQIGLEKLRKKVDTLIVLENDRLLDLFPDLPLTDAFRAGDDILIRALVGLSALILKKGLINLDFADVSMIMRDGPNAVIGLGESSSEKRGEEAVRRAVSHPMMETNIAGAQSALIHVSGGPNMTLKETRSVIKSVAERLDPSARIIWGATIDKSLKKTLRVMLILSGLKDMDRLHYKGAGIIGAQIQPAVEEKEQSTETVPHREEGRTIFDIKDTIMSAGSELTPPKKPQKPMTQTTMIFYKIFEEEATGDLKRLERTIRLLRENPENRRALLDAKQAGKLLHASAQMFGFDEIGELLSAVDKILTCAQSREIRLVPKILDSISLAMEMVVDLVENRSDGRGETGYIVDRLNELKEEQLESLS